MRRFFVVAAVALALLHVPRSHAEQRVEFAKQDQFALVSSRWDYKFDPDSSLPHRVTAIAVIENTTDFYLKDVAARFTAVSSSGGELDHSTEVPIKSVVAPGERTVVSAAMYDDALLLTSSVRILAFGELADASDSHYLPDPTVSYLRSKVDGGYIRHWGEISNLSGRSWHARCKYCNAVSQVAIASVGDLISDYGTDSIGMAPDGHLPPGGRVAFRHAFERLPGMEISYYYAIEPMPEGQHPATWRAEGVRWSIEDSFGSKRFVVNGDVVNTSDVASDPNVWIIGYDEEGAWIGWTSCSSFSEIRPGDRLKCRDEYISSINMHHGEVTDIVRAEILAASSEVSAISPPTLTPTATAVPTNTPVPSATPTASVTPIHTETSTPRPTPTVLEQQSIFLPRAIR